MNLKQDICYHKIDKEDEETDYSITFVPSGFLGLWLKVWELYDYTIDIKYASAEENAELNSIATSGAKRHKMPI